MRIVARVAWAALLVLLGPFFGSVMAGSSQSSSKETVTSESMTSETVTSSDSEDASWSADPQVRRGRYLVHEVARCVECHSPRDRSGKLQQDRLLEGGPIPFENPFDGPRWAFQAPYIKNMPGYTEAELVRLLMTGVRRSGDRPAAPMPQYRMEREDALAIWAYLKTPADG